MQLTSSTPPSCHVGTVQPSLDGLKSPQVHSCLLNDSRANQHRASTMLPTSVSTCASLSCGDPHLPAESATQSASLNTPTTPTPAIKTAPSAAHTMPHVTYATPAIELDDRNCRCTRCAHHSMTGTHVRKQLHKTTGDRMHLHLP